MVILSFPVREAGCESWSRDQRHHIGTVGPGGCILHDRPKASTRGNSDWWRTRVRDEWSNVARCRTAATGDAQRPGAGIHLFVIDGEFHREFCVDRLTAAMADSELQEPQIVNFFPVIDVDLAQRIGEVHHRKGANPGGLDVDGNRKLDSKDEGPQNNIFFGIGLTFMLPPSARQTR